MSIKQIINKLSLYFLATSFIFIAIPSAVINESTKSSDPEEATTSSQILSTSTNETLLPVYQLEDEEKLLLTESAEIKADVTGKFVSGEVLLKFKDNINTKKKVEILTTKDLKIKKISHSTGIRVLKVKEGEEVKIADELRNDPFVEKVSLNDILYAQEGGGGGGGSTYGGCNPNDSYYCSGLQSYLRQNGAEYGWPYSKGSSSKIIAILDTGVDYTHPDLDGKIWNNTGEVVNGRDDDGNGVVDDIRGANFVVSPPSSNVMDDNNHGTAVAGVATAETNNSIGVAGMNWGARIMPVKVAGYAGLGSAYDVAEGIRYAVDEGAKVINISFGGPGDSFGVMQSAVSYARSRGVIIVAGAMNSTNPSCFIGFPAAYPGVVSVTSYGVSLSSYSGCTQTNYNGQNYQPIQTSAAAENVYHPLRGGGYGSLNYGKGPRTSFATPIVSGIAAILLDCNPNHLAVIETLKHGGVNYDPDWKYGYTSAHLFFQLGFLNCY